MDSGLKTLEDEIRSGADWEEVMQHRAAEKAAIDRLMALKRSRPSLFARALLFVINPALQLSAERRGQDAIARVLSGERDAAIAAMAAGMKPISEGWDG